MLPAAFSNGDVSWTTTLWAYCSLFVMWGPPPRYCGSNPKATCQLETTTRKTNSHTRMIWNHWISVLSQRGGRQLSRQTFEWLHSCAQELFMLWSFFDGKAWGRLTVLQARTSVSSASEQILWCRLGVWLPQCHPAQPCTVIESHINSQTYLLTYFRPMLWARSAVSFAASEVRWLYRRKNIRITLLCSSAMHDN